MTDMETLLPRYAEEANDEHGQHEQEAREAAQAAVLQGTALALACEAFYRQLAACMTGMEEGQAEQPLFTREEILSLLHGAVGHMHV